MIRSENKNQSYHEECSISTLEKNSVVNENKKNLHSILFYFQYRLKEIYCLLHGFPLLYEGKIYYLKQKLHLLRNFTKRFHKN